MRLKGLQEVGLPAGSTVRGLAICEPARCLIAHVEVRDDSGASHRLYVRTFDEQVYAELIPHQEGLDIRDPIASPTLPFLYFNRVSRSGAMGIWDGLFRVECRSRMVERLLPLTPARGGFIGRVIGISGDGHRLLVTTTLPERSHEVGHTIYAAASLDLSTLALTPLAELEATVA